MSEGVAIGLGFDDGAVVRKPVNDCGERLVSERIPRDLLSRLDPAVLENVAAEFVTTLISNPTIASVLQTSR